MLRVAALQYCASDNAAKTLNHIQPLIAEAASKAVLLRCPNVQTILLQAASNYSKEPNGTMKAIAKNGSAILRVTLVFGCSPGH